MVKKGIKMQSESENIGRTPYFGGKKGGQRPQFGSKEIRE